MCGIAGFTWSDRELACRMMTSLAHRGPDSRGIHVEDNLSLVFDRLAIQDLSDSGNQPMFTPDGSIVLVYNGEIYNYPELRPELESLGYSFRSHCDTEAILYAYQEWGLEAVHRLRGMFALALWDRPRQRLWLARDRIGIKPLYYHQSNGRLSFASEIKAILQDPAVPREFNPQAFYDYLGFEFVPAPDTMFRGISKLPAGHQLIWENGRARVEQYWDLSFAPRDLQGKTVDDLVAELRHELSACVKSHLLSDVPLGVFLSGGLDSGALVAFMRQHISGPLRTFTIGYPDPSFSEIDAAAMVARHFETEHHVLMVEGVTREVIERSVYHFDEPMTDLSSIPLMLACQKAREQVTVALSGEGGDEVFAGYDRFKASRMNRYYSMIPGPVRHQLIARLVRLLPDRPQKKGAVNLLKRFIEGSELDKEGQHLRWQYFLNRPLCQGLFSPGFRDHIDQDPFRVVREHNARCDASDPLNRELYLDTRFLMADSILMKVDKMSMAHSLEVRVPILDHGFVELAAGLPGKWKLKGLETKHIFRKVLTGVLPEQIVWGRKQGYSLPIKNLLRGELKDYMITVLNDSPLLRDITNRPYVNQLITEHLEQRQNHNHVLWGLMTTALWHQRFLAA